MKFTGKAGLIAALLLAAAAAQAQSEWSANVGWASDYFYRGIHQKQSSVSGGIDYGNSGFYAGVWAADVGELTGNGLEIDGYFGYGGTVGDFSYGAGFTGYYYTGDFDDTYQEINLGAGFSLFSFDVAVGEYENFDGPTLDYIYYSITAEKDGFYGKYAGFSQDFEGEYVEVGYGTTIAELDVGLSLIFSNSDLVGESDEAVVFTIGKSFDIN